MLLAALLVALHTASASALSIHAQAREQHKIPRIVHQFLQEGALPPAAAHRQKTWKAAHPHWDYKCAVCCHSRSCTRQCRTAACQACLFQCMSHTQGCAQLRRRAPRRLWTHDLSSKLVAEHYAWCRLRLCPAPYKVLLGK